MCGLMADLVICKFGKDGYTWHWMSLLRPGVIKQPKPKQNFDLPRPINYANYPQLCPPLRLYFWPRLKSFVLQKWAEFIRECDPDIITGYNIQNFDLPYLINRANHLKLKHFTYLGRLKDIRSTLRETVLQSKQMGKRENKVINIEGRVQFDLLQVRCMFNHQTDCPFTLGRVQFDPLQVRYAFNHLTDYPFYFGMGSLICCR